MLVPLFVNEVQSEAIQKLLLSLESEDLAISDWTMTEFVSALGIKVRTGQVPDMVARQISGEFVDFARGSLRVFNPASADFDLARQFLEDFQVGLRAGDALHLAIAYNQRVDRFYTQDRRLFEIAKNLGFPSALACE